MYPSVVKSFTVKNYSYVVQMGRGRQGYSTSFIFQDKDLAEEVYDSITLSPGDKVRLFEKGKLIRRDIRKW